MHSASLPRLTSRDTGRVFSHFNNRGCYLSGCLLPLAGVSLNVRDGHLEHLLHTVGVHSDHFSSAIMQLSRLGSGGSNEVLVTELKLVLVGTDEASLGALEARLLGLLGF